MGIKFEWNHPKRLGNSYKVDLTYQLNYCQLVAFNVVVSELQQVPEGGPSGTTGSTGDSVDGKTKASGDGKITKLVWKQVNVTVEKYKPVECQTQIIRLAF